MKQCTISISTVFLSLLMMISLISCSEAEEPEVADPRDIFIGSYTSEINRYCNKKTLYTSNISLGSTSNIVIWSNILGEDGNEDDVKAIVSGNKMTFPKQNIDKLEFKGTAQLMPNGDLEVSTIIISGVATIECTSYYISN